MTIEIADDVRATHADLSPAALDFLRYVAEDPESRARPLPLPELPPWVETYPVQAWPVLLGAAKLRTIEADTTGVTRLVKALPERVFGRDAKRLAAYYRLGNEFLAALLVAPPNGIPGAIARLDYVDTPAGLNVLEVNAGGGTLGGWEMRFWAEHYRTTPVLARFFTERGIEPLARDPWVAFFRHVVEDVGKGRIPRSGELNLALVAPETDAARLVEGLPQFNASYRAVLAEQGLEGRILVSTYPGGLAVQGGTHLTCEGRRVHAVLECTHQPTPRDVYRCFKAGGLHLYNGPLSQMLGDKRNLALLSEHAESGLFDAGERELIQRCIPWSRVVEDRTVSWQDDKVPLLDLLRRQRGRFVLKPGTGRHGDGVVVGPRAAPEAWEAALAGAAAQGTWVAQEVVTSRPYLGQAGAVGSAPHEVVWGTFCFGERYGGGFVRMMPQGHGNGVINSSRGATEGFLFEV